MIQEKNEENKALHRKSKIEKNKQTTRMFLFC